MDVAGVGGGANVSLITAGTLLGLVPTLVSGTPASPGKPETILSRLSAEELWLVALGRLERTRKLVLNVLPLPGALPVDVR